MSVFQSSGRGGAGNIVEKSKSPPLEPKDLETPTLKTSVVTTGRGGTGNMAKNVDPAETRARQDVEPVARQEPSGVMHIGRGGTGNIVKPPVEDEETGNLHKAQKGEAADGGRANVEEDQAAADGLAAKGKQWIFGKK